MPLPKSIIFLRLEKIKEKHTFKLCRKEVFKRLNNNSIPPLNWAQVKNKCCNNISMAFFVSDQANLEYVKLYLRD